MRLAKNVKVCGKWYGPAHGNAGRVPDDVAAQITNPKAWEPEPEPKEEPEPKRAPGRGRQKASDGSGGEPKGAQ